MQSRDQRRNDHESLHEPVAQEAQAGDHDGDAEHGEAQHEPTGQPNQALAGRSLGSFLITHYTFALESDPRHAHSPKVSAPGLPPEHKYRESFLGSPLGIKMQGTGLAEDGQYIRYAGHDRYAYGVGGAGGRPEAWKTVAVDPSVIPMHSQIIIDCYRDKGTFEARDTGGAIRGQHIDVFAGAIPLSEAFALGRKQSQVELVSGGTAGPGPSGGGGTPHGGRKTAPPLDQVRAGSAVLKRGMKGPSVTEVQHLLHIGADGSYGPATAEAVKAFQRAHHLQVDGKVGKHTLAKLEGAPASQTGGTPAPAQQTGGTPAPAQQTGGAPAPAQQTGGERTTESAVRDEVLRKAESHLGAPYSWGASGPSMFDCSGFAWYVLHTDTHLTHSGRTNAAGLAHGVTTGTGAPEKGDLVFYAQGGSINHVTIAAGSGSRTIGASGGGHNTHGQNPNAKVKYTDWHRDHRAITFGSIRALINARLHAPTT